MNDTTICLTFSTAFLLVAGLDIAATNDRGSIQRQGDWRYFRLFSRSWWPLERGVSGCLQTHRTTFLDRLGLLPMSTETRQSNQVFPTDRVLSVGQPESQFLVTKSDYSPRIPVM